MSIDGVDTVAILCGGRGTRLREHATAIPKPLVEIGGEPILWHVMQIYASQGIRRFVLCAGYKGELIDEFARTRAWPADTEVICLDTGLDTPTGGRIHRAAEHVGPGTFSVAYADGVADIDLAALVAFHRQHGGTATMTVVRPELQFGVAEFAGEGRVTGFQEKPRSDHWVNGGFFCFEPGALDYVTESSVLEREPLEGLAGDGRLYGYRHTGFWQCVDTYKDTVRLNDLWAQERPPWKTWSD